MRIIRHYFQYFLLIVGCITITHSSVAQIETIPKDSIPHHFFDEGMKKIRARSYDSANIFFKKALPLFEAQEQWFWYVKCQNELALITLNIGDTPRPAIELLKFTLEKTKDKFDTLPEVIAITHDFLAGGYTYLGDFDSSLYHDKKAIETARLTLGEYDRRLAISHNNIANTYKGKRDFKKALYHTQKSIAINQQLKRKHKHLEVHSYTQLLNIAKVTNDVEKIKEYLPLALILAEETYDSISVSMSNQYSDVVAPFITLQQYDTALYYQQKSLDMLSRWPDKYWANRRNGITNMANIHRYKGDFEKGLTYINQAEHIAKDQQHVHPNVLTIFTFKTALLDSLGRFSEAEESLVEHKDYIHSNFKLDTLRISRYYTKLGNHYDFVKNYDKALTSFQSGLAFTVHSSKEKLGNDPYFLPNVEDIKHYKGAFNLLSAKSRTLMTLNGMKPNDELTETTIAHLRMTLNIIDQLKQDEPVAGSKIQLYDKNVDLSQALITCLLTRFEKSGESQDLEEALAVAQRSQAQRLRESLNGSEARTFAGIPETLTQMEFQANTDIAFYQQKLNQVYSQGKAPNPEKIKLWTTKIADNRRLADSLQRIIQTSHPSYYNLKYQNSFPNLAQLQGNLHSNKHALINYIWCDSTIFSITITKQSAYVNKIETHGNFINKITAFRDVLDYRKNNNRNTGTASFAKLSNEMYQELLQPATQHLSNQIDRLTIIPDSWLAWIPFEILVTAAEPATESFKDLHYAINDYTINYAYSASLWKNETKSQSSWEEVFAGFAPFYKLTELKEAPELIAYADYRDEIAPLAYASDEVAMASNLFNGKTFISEEASEAQFKANIGKYQIMHLAMHALVDEDNPLLSKMIFTQNSDTTEDGFLHAYELYNTRINSDLAVLSACNTGFGTLARGEGVMSLSRAFAYAGCKSVVMSLWPAQDRATAEIMNYFYEALSDGENKDEALRTAKLKYVDNNSDLVLHPYYWAGFVVSGDVNKLSKPTPWLTYGLLLLTIIAIIWVLYKKYIKK